MIGRLAGIVGRPSAAVILPVVGLLLIGLLAFGLSSGTPTLAPVAAGEAILVSGPGVDLSDRLEWCTTGRETSFDEIRAGACHFLPASRGDLEIGGSSRVHWVRTTLVGAEAPPQDLWLIVGHRRLQSVTYLVEGDDGEVHVSRTGLSVPLSMRPVDASAPILPLRLVAGHRLTVYARVESRTSINLTTSLWRPRAHTEMQRRLEFWEVAAAGGLLAAAAFSLMIAAAGRVSQWSRRTNLWLGMAMLAKAVFNTANAGLLPLWVMPGDHALGVGVQAIALGATVLFMLLFLRPFAESDPRAGVWDLILGGVIGFVTISTLWVVVIDYKAGFRALTLASAAVVLLGVVLFARLAHFGVAAAGYMLTVFTLNLLVIVHRLVRSYAGLDFDDGLLLLYSWSYLLTVPLVPIGIAMHEEAARIAAEKAEAEATARIEFLARVSHELRTPLDTILGNAQLLARPSGASLLREGLGIIHDSARHLLRMIDDLLDYSRGVAGRLTVMPVPVDWPAFLTDLQRTGTATAAAGGDGFALTVVGASPPLLEFDAVRLRQVLDNLLRNAARHTSEGRISVSCDVGSTDADGGVEVSFTVSDTGEGIAPEDHERIFLPFQRGRGTEVRHGAKGIGMGLTIARQLVEAMGGRLTVESALGRGAAFHFTIRTRAVAAPAIAPIGGVHVSGTFGRGRRLVVADDEAHSRRILGRLFAEHGFDVVEAGSGREAIAACSAGASIDLVICDQFMADGDGWEVLRRLTRNRPEIPIVLVSAAPPERPADCPKTLDFAARFLKPLDHDRLLEAVADLLGLALDPVDAAAPPPAPPTTPRAVTALPPAAERAALGELVADGRFGEVIRRAEEMKRSDPALAAFADELRAAALSLDLPALDRLLGAAAPPTDA